MIGSDGRSTIVISAIPGPIPRTLPGKCILQQILSGAVQFQFLRHTSADIEHIPGKPMNLMVVDPQAMGHQQPQVITARSDVEIDQRSATTRDLQLPPGFVLQRRMDRRMPDKSADISLDATDRQFRCHSDSSFLAGNRRVASCCAVWRKKTRAVAPAAAHDTDAHAC
jgi:hypothetical protein